MAWPETWQMYFSHEQVHVCHSQWDLKISTLGKHTQSLREPFVESGHLRPDISCIKIIPNAKTSVATEQTLFSAYSGARYLHKAQPSTSIHHSFFFVWCLIDTHSEFLWSSKFRLARPQSASCTYTSNSKYNNSLLCQIWALDRVKDTIALDKHEIWIDFYHWNKFTCETYVAWHHASVKNRASPTLFM